MPQGIQVFDASGVEVFSTANRGYRVLTVVLAAGSNGSTVVPALATGTPVVTVTPGNADRDQPVPSVAGTTVSWVYDGTIGVRDTSARLNVAVY